MRHRLAVLVCALGALCVIAAADDPFTGTWKLNPAKSSLMPPVPRSVIGHIRCDAESVSLREEVETASGEHQTTTVNAKFDGKDYPIEGFALADTVMYERLDARTIRGTSKKDGKVLVHETVVLAPDGRSFTATYTGTDKDGRTVTGTAVFEKQ